MSRTLELAASVLGDGDEPLLRFPRGDYTVPSRQRLAAVAVLAEREARLSAVQRLALVDAAAWWLTDPAGGQELAHALIDGACGQPGDRRARVPHIDHITRAVGRLARLLGG